MHAHEYVYRARFPILTKVQYAKHNAAAPHNTYILYMRMLADVSCRVHCCALAIKIQGGGGVRMLRMWVTHTPNQYATPEGWLKLLVCSGIFSHKSNGRVSETTKRVRTDKPGICIRFSELFLVPLVTRNIMLLIMFRHMANVYHRSMWHLNTDY